MSFYFLLHLLYRHRELKHHNSRLSLVSSHSCSTLAIPLVDLLEPVSLFLEAARENLSPENVIVLDSHKASSFYCVPLQGGLKTGGIFVLKENIARTGFILDKEDRSITRSNLYFKELFDRCGLHIYKSKDQKGFTEELFQVKIYALTPDLPKRVNRTRPKGKTNRPGIIK